jgi:putative nucleotidyltransferase with HDIG domain
MATTSTSASPPSYLTVEQLRLGVFVMLDLLWFRHPFPLGSFKIKTEAQLRELRALKLKRYRYDPLRSDLPPQASAQLASDGASGHDMGPKPEPELETEPAEEATPELIAKRQRRESNKARREQIEQVEIAFIKATALMKGLNKNIFAKPKETLEEIGSLVGEMIDAFLLSPEVTLHVMGEKAGGEDVYFHSLNVTILGMMLAKNLNFTLEQAREMGVGAMLHDIGLTDIPDHIAKRPRNESSKAETSLRATHVQLGVAMGQRIGLSKDAMSVIEQHHELADGSGYPIGTKEAAMSPGARLISLINYYDNLCNPPDIASAMTPHEALSFMFAKNRAKFDAKALQFLIRSLGVHPPGSIVQLSNETLALVTSVNPQKPLRPNVLIYDERVPKDEAISLDLEHEPDINIIKSIRPGMLSTKVAAYLNPPRRVTYFFDSSSGSKGGGGGAA